MKTKSFTPKQYQQGWTEFYKLKFKLTPDVLIPRPETELLVEQVIKENPLTVLDIGTGSGCIAISIAKNLPQAKVIATDTSPKALEVAKTNAKFHRVDGRIFFIHSDLLDFTSHLGGGINSKAPDVIAANLPYIPTARLMLLDPMVKDFEPRIALDGGRDGFELYRRLFGQMVEKKLIPKLFIGEIDYTQAEVVLAEAKKYFPTAQSYIKMDLAKLERFILIEF